jgi:DNA-binding transcriptional LysR family regulator
MARIDGIRGIVSFVRTVAAGSFAGAAKDLGITPVAVSKNVQRLEQQVGARLLQRSTRKLSLTAEGRLFYERCAVPLQELENAKAAVREKSSSPAGTIRVTSITPFARTYVQPLLPAFSRLYPKIEVELHLDDRLSDMIAEGYDVGIRAGALRDANIVVRDIAPLHFVVCAAPSYLAQHGVPLTPAELSAHNCLRLCRHGRADRPLNWTLGPEHGPVTLPVRGNFVANDITTLVVAALQGQGLVLAPLPLVLPLFRAGSLAPVLPQWVSQPAHIFLHYPNRKLPARVRSFVNFLLDNLRGNPDLGPDAQSMIAPFLMKSG